MALYIVVRHPQNPDSTYTNEWTADKHLLISITTPKDVAMALASERALDARVFVHRCAWDGAPARISCAVLVGKIELLDQRDYLVTFIDPEPMDNEPPLPAHQVRTCMKLHHRLHSEVAGSPKNNGNRHLNNSGSRQEPV